MIYIMDYNSFNTLLMVHLQYNAISVNPKLFPNLNPGSCPSPNPGARTSPIFCAKAALRFKFFQPLSYYTDSDVVLLL